MTRTRQPLPGGVIGFVVVAAGVLWVVFGQVGCAKPVVSVANPFEIDHSEYGRMFRASVSALRDLGFEVSLQDYRFGRIETSGLNSPTVFEPWRGTNSTAGQAVQSTVSHERRRVVIRLAPRTTGLNGSDVTAAAYEAPGAYMLDVKVLMHRQRVTGRNLTGSTAEQRIFSAQGRSLSRGSSEQRGGYWQPIGRDHELEQRLLNAIVRRSMTLRS